MAVKINDVVQARSIFEFFRLFDVHASMRLRYSGQRTKASIEINSRGYTELNISEVPLTVHVNIQMRIKAAADGRGSSPAQNGWLCVRRPTLSRGRVSRLSTPFLTRIYGLASPSRPNSTSLIVFVLGGRRMHNLLGSSIRESERGAHPKGWRLNRWSYIDDRSTLYLEQNDSLQKMK